MAGSEREQQILREARSLISDEGVQSLTMRRLGRRSQIAAAGIYHYFRSRDDLVDHLHEEVFVEFKNLLGPAPTAQTPEAVADWLASGQSWLVEHPELIALTTECGLRLDMANLPMDFVEVLLGSSNSLNPSSEASAVKPCLIGDAAILLLRAASLPQGSVDLTRMVSNFRSHTVALAPVAVSAS